MHGRTNQNSPTHARHACAILSGVISPQSFTLLNDTIEYGDTVRYSSSRTVLSGPDIIRIVLTLRSVSRSAGHESRLLQALNHIFFIDSPEFV